MRFFVGRFCISGAIFRGSVLNFWCDFSWVDIAFLVRFFSNRMLPGGHPSGSRPADRQISGANFCALPGAIF